MSKVLLNTAMSAALVLSCGNVLADIVACRGLPTYAQLKLALKASVPGKAGGTLRLTTIDAKATGNGGLDLPMWATIVGRDGTVCAVVYSGPAQVSQWFASRVISAQKAYTANSLTVAGAPGIWSTAKLWAPTQPGGFLYGLQASNPVDPAVAYKGPSSNWGTPNDPLVGKIMGGNNVFGGGVSLWKKGAVAGGLGVSGDTSCADHNIALRVRDYLVALGIGLADNRAGKYADNIIYDIVGGHSASGFGHPTCPGGLEDEINTQITGIDHTSPGHDDFPNY